MAYPTEPSTVTGPALPEEELPAEWADLTERIELPQATQPFAGFGENQTLKLERVGCAAQAEILVKLSFKTAKEDVDPAIGMPWAFIRRLAMEANGVAGIISCSGTVLEARQKVVYRSPEHAVVGTANAENAALKEETTYTYEWVIQVPIAEDLKELEGIVLAQSEETALGLTITWGTEAELFEAGKVTEVKGEVRWHMVLFSIGSMNEGKKKIIVLPDLTSLHGLVERSTPVVAEGEQEAPLTRTSGDLLRYFVSLFKKGSVVNIDPLAWTTLYLQYGGNQKPIVFGSPKILAERNARDYLKRPDVGIGAELIHFAVLDTMLDDPLRDAIRPMALSELKVVIGVPEAVETGARILSAQETLYPSGV
jgi:hypothetical protein